jgi:hypothetical protein
MALESSALRVVPAPEEALPLIVVAPGQLAREVDECFEVLRTAGLYRQGRTLVRISMPNDPDRPARALATLWHGPVVVAVTAPWLRGELARLARFQKPDSDRMRPVDPPLSLCSTLIEVVDSSNMPELMGIVMHPTLRADGSVLDAPGYDAASGLLYLPDPSVKWPKIPDNPTRDDAVAAVQRLLRLLREFPFADGSAPPGTSLSVAVATIVTVCLRKALRSAPGTGITAPTAGTGKSLLTDLATTVATGRPVPAMSHCDDPAEEAKRIHAALMEGTPVLSIDNVVRPLKSDVLCSVLTQERFSARVLGKSETQVVSTAVSVIANGNNLIVGGDLVRRFLICRMDTGAARPDEIEHTFDPVEEARRDRGELVAAVITVVRAYLSAGCPSMGLKPFGSFGQWSTWVRSALVWAGCADPCGGRSAMEASDPERDVAVGVAAAWYEEFNSEPTTIRVCLRESKDNEELDAALSLIPSMSGKPSAHSIGQWVKRQQDRPYPLPCGGGVLTFRASGIDTRTKAIRWAVVRSDFAESTESTESVSYPESFRVKNNQWESDSADSVDSANDRKVIRYRLADNPGQWNTAINETEIGLVDRFGDRLIEVQQP